MIRIDYIISIREYIAANALEAASVMAFIAYDNNLVGGSRKTTTTMTLTTTTHNDTDIFELLVIFRLHSGAYNRLFKA